MNRAGSSTDPAATPHTLLDEAAIRERVHHLAERITADHPDGVVLVGVLKGALLLLADLARALRDIEVSIDFVAISRYAPDSGRVRILRDIDLEIAGRDVILVEDLVDTGLTLGYLVGYLQARQPRSVDVCVLLDRPARRILPLAVRYVGMEIPDVFVLGYGLQHGDRYRNLSRVVQVDRARLSADPDAYVGDLYGNEARR